MENPQYKSLTEKLMQNGLLPQDEVDVIEEIDEKDNFFATSNYSFNQNPIEQEFSLKRKRINEYDLNLIQNNRIEENKHYQTLDRFLKFKKNIKTITRKNFLEIVFARIFPRVYKARLVKEAMSKLLELNIDAKTLLDKTIPYGENELRYGDLVKYLNYANEIQTRLREKF